MHGPVHIETREREAMGVRRLSAQRPVMTDDAMLAQAIQDASVGSDEVAGIKCGAEKPEWREYGESGGRTAGNARGWLIGA
jgi:precorrin isomerase